MAQERCLGHGGRGLDLADQLIADAADVDGQRAGRLGHKVDGAKLKRVECDLGVGSGSARQHHDASGRLEHEAFEHAQSIKDGHLDIEGDDVRLQLAGELQPLFTISGNAGDFQAGHLTKEAPERMAHEGRVVADQNSDWSHLDPTLAGLPGSPNGSPRAPAAGRTAGWVRQPATC